MSLVILSPRQDCLAGVDARDCFVLESIPPKPTGTDSLVVATDVEGLPPGASTRDRDIRSGDTRTALITVGCVGGIAVLLLLIYWVAIHITTRRHCRTCPHNVEEGMKSPPMMHTNPQSPFLLPPMPGRAANAQSPLLPEVPRIKKAVMSERHSRTPYNFYISDALAKRCSSIHPGTKVLFGNASRLKEVPARKPVPSRHAVPSRAGTERTESLWSDEGDDDASTVLGDDGRPQRKMAADVFRPLPPGRTIVSWLGGSKGSGSGKNGGQGPNSK